MDNWSENQTQKKQAHKMLLQMYYQNYYQFPFHFSMFNEGIKEKQKNPEKIGRIIKDEKKSSKYLVHHTCCGQKELWSIF